MEDLLNPYFSWSDFIIAALLLWGSYWLLLQLRKRLSTGVFFGRYQAGITNFIGTFLLLYEPITVLLLTIVFFFINPVIHGILLILLTIAGFSRIRDYLSGRIILATDLVAVGRRVKTPQASGVISRIGRIGLYLQTGENLAFVNYSKLLVEGYSLSTGTEVGGYFQLNLSRPEGVSMTDALRFLADKFLLTPYLQADFPPELVASNRKEGWIDARVAVREERQLHELVDLIEEWGYEVQLARK